MNIKFIRPSYEIDMLGQSGIEKLKSIEYCARTCYKSDHKITDNSYEALIKMLKKNNHTAMFEFADFKVKFICNRTVSHQLVRHRIPSFAQQSQRYCIYKDEITFIVPEWFGDNWELTERNELQIYKATDAQNLWIESMYTSWGYYDKLMEKGLRAEQARGVLPNDIATEINVKTNLREWIHIFSLRDDTHADPAMRQLMSPLHEDIKQLIPIVFD